MCASRYFKLLTEFNLLVNMFGYFLQRWLLYHEYHRSYHDMSCIMTYVMGCIISNSIYFASNIAFRWYKRSYSLHGIILKSFHINQLLLLFPLALFLPQFILNFSAMKVENSPISNSISLFRITS